jgi:hypothetical protein
MGSEDDAGVGLGWFLSHGCTLPLALWDVPKEWHYNLRPPCFL